MSSLLDFRVRMLFPHQSLNDAPGWTKADVRVLSLLLPFHRSLLLELCRPLVRTDRVRVLQAWTKRLTLSRSPTSGPRED